MKNAQKKPLHIPLFDGMIGVVREEFFDIVEKMVARGEAGNATYAMPQFY
jgi:hypothetical protein